MPSVMQTTSSIPAWAASRIASAATGGGHVDDGGVGAGLLDRVRDGVEHREPSCTSPALARGHPADDVGAVLAHLLGVEGPGRAGDPLDDQLGVLSDEDAHGYLAPFASATTFCAPSAMSLAVVTARPDSASIFLPSSTLVPSSRTTSGTLSRPP